MAFTYFQVLLMVGMLVTGSINTLSKKAQNDCVASGYPVKNGNKTTSEPHQFNHPWFQTLIMFLGETICLFGFWAVRRKERLALQEKVGHIPKESSLETPKQVRIFQPLIAIPTICDLIGTSLAGIGLVYIDASVWQMLRGSIIIFAGILSKIFLKRKLYGLHWTGMIVTMVGLVLVGCSSVFKTEHNNSGSHTLIGIILILSSQLVSASQMVIEELFLKKRSFHPLHVVGMEGSYGVIFMVVAVLPAMYFIPGGDVNNSYENSLDALYQIGNSPKLLAFSILYLLSIAFYNYFGLAVTRSLTAVHRTLIDACRTILVWIVDLIIYYAFDKDFGEPFDNSYGLLQVDGFLFLLIGTSLYNQLIHVECIPCLRKQPQEMKTVVNPHRHENIQDSDGDEHSSEEDEAQPSERTRLLKDRDG